MSIDLSVYGNHSIVFNGREIADKQEVLDKLNSLKFEESDFLLKMCKRWHTPPFKDNEEWILEEQKNLEQALQIRSWRISTEYDECYPYTNEYWFTGPFGFGIEITNHYIDIYPWVGRYRYWYNVTEEKDIQWRDTWRLIIYKIIHVLGGDCAIYLPDNNSDLACYLPCSYDMPEFNHLIRIISEEYSAPFTSFVEAAKLYIENKLDKDPFVIDKFEDVQSRQLN
jgi:hypothetical protein